MTFAPGGQRFRFHEPYISEDAGGKWPLHFEPGSDDGKRFIAKALARSELPAMGRPLRPHRHEQPPRLPMLRPDLRLQIVLRTVLALQLAEVFETEP
jgi:hypothetical protein